MNDTTNPRARLDEALEEMRSTLGSSSQPVRLTAEAVVACAEALSLLVGAHLPEPEPDPREDLPDDTPVGHGWVMAWYGSGLFKPYGNGRFTGWREESRTWGVEGNWHKPAIYHTRPATVGDLRRVGVPVTEWPDITAPEPEPVPSRAEKAEAELRARELHHFEAEQSEAKAIAERDNAIAALRAIRHQLVLGAAHLNQSDDVRETYRKSWMLLEAGARSHGIDLDEEAP